jgi:hypothetical protein
MNLRSTGIGVEVWRKLSDTTCHDAAARGAKAQSELMLSTLPACPQPRSKIWYERFTTAMFYGSIPAFDESIGRILKFADARTSARA